jgi:hypothetical protein
MTYAGYLFRQKVLTYVKYIAVSGVFQNIDPPPPSPTSECVLPPHQRRGGGGYTLAGRWGVGGGVNTLEDARHWIGLLQYILSMGVSGFIFVFKFVVFYSMWSVSAELCKISWRFLDH